MWKLKILLVLFALVSALSVGQAQPKFTILGETPEWRTLDRHQDKWTRAEFEKNLWVYSPDSAIYKFCDFTEERLRLYSDLEKTNLLWELRFTKKPTFKPLSPFRIKPPHTAAFLGATLEKPLHGLRICIDPGHIGGEWSNVEERYFKIKKNLPIEEATLNIITCRILETLLIQAGAEIVWTKNDYEPVTSRRPDDLTWEGIELLFRRTPKAYEKLSKKKLLYEARWNAELAFYRPAEIGARAKRVEELQPDFTVCLHYNAAPWPNPKRPRLIKANKLIVFVLGSFMAEELSYDDQKFNLIRKVLEDSFDLEVALATSMAESMEKGLQLPPENYDSFVASRRVNENRYVWSRNLLANRLFIGPTIFVEGPYMNDVNVHARLQAGDYEGEKLVDGKSVRSLYREYAESVSEGIITYYRNRLSSTVTGSSF